MNNEIILGQSIDYAVESDRHQHCSLSAQGVIALLKISPLSIFETTPPLTESGIFFHISTVCYSDSAFNTGMMF